MALEIECRNKRIKNLEDFIDSDSYKMIDEAVARSYNCDGIECYGVTVETYESNGHEWVCYGPGSIDHQSSEGYTTLAEWLDDMNVTLDEFIFDKNSKLIISNDND